MSSHNHYTIRAYHGELPKKLSDILDYIACPQGGDVGGELGTWFYDGGLDNFAREWPGIFYVKGDILWVTQFNNFNQR